MSGRERGWGPWTVTKLDALSKYLSGFTTASKNRSPVTLYLDLFAGGFESHERGTGRPIEGSPQRALAVKPELSKLVFCELNEERADALEAEVKLAFPGRDVKVLPGDCNESIPRYLAELVSREEAWRWRPAFAFIDQFSAEIHWTTIQRLAGLRSESKYKTELWLYFGESFLVRGLGLTDQADQLKYMQRIDRMYGNRAWREIHEGWKNRLLTGAQRKSELVNLMRWQLEQELGYRYTLPLQVVRDDGNPLYTMIFATDNETGDTIMRSVLTGAAAQMDERSRGYKLRAQLAKKEAQGVVGFEALDEQLTSAHVKDPGKKLLTLAPPAQPWTYPTD
ncbi:MAG: three-Cys-motif partner protein TcmP [Micrococcales bacterium]|nr:three-Cys-motif partner protein TcmP [Micrococcales bacterium]